MLNVPMGDTAAFRVSGRYRNRDGFIGNLLGGPDFNSVDTGAIRGTLHWAPTEPDQHRHFRQLPGGPSARHLVQIDAASSRPIRPRAPCWATAAPIAAPRWRRARASRAARPRVDREVWGVTGIVRAELADRFTLTSISAYREFDGIEIFDADGISLQALTAAADESGDQPARNSGSPTTMRVRSPPFWASPISARRAISAPPPSSTSG